MPGETGGSVSFHCEIDNERHATHPELSIKHDDRFPSFLDVSIGIKQDPLISAFKQLDHALVGEGAVGPIQFDRIRRHNLFFI